MAADVPGAPLHEVVWRRTGTSQAGALTIEVPDQQHSIVMLRGIRDIGEGGAP